MKKRILVSLISAVTAFSMVGCGSKSNEVPIPEVSSEDSTLSIYVWDENFNIPALKAAEEDYRQVNPNFKLEVITKDNSDVIEDEIKLASENGDFRGLPDMVLFQDHAIGRYVNNYNDAFMSANDAVVDWKNLGEEKISFSVVNGEHYGFPVDAGTAVFAYRVDILEECGYTIDDMTGISWFEFDKIGKEVYEKTGKYLISAIGKDNDLIFMMLQAEGESAFRKGNPFFIGNDTLDAVINTIVTLYNDNVLYLAEDWDDYTVKTIGRDMVAGIYDGNWILNSLEQVGYNKGKWMITTAPTLIGGEGYASNGGSSICLTSNCRNPELAKEFLAYTFGGGSAIDGDSLTYDKALEKAGLVGTCVAAAKSDIYKKGNPYFNNQPIYEMIVEYSQKVPTVEQSDYHYECRRILSNVVLDCINNDSPVVEDVLREAETELREKMN